MKKIIFAFVFMALIMPVFAQNTPRDGGLYCLNVPVERIFPTKDGYIIMYRSSTIIDTIGLPNDWFSFSGGKAEMVQLADAGDWPSMTVFYRDGEFSHVKLYVHRAKSHHTWGSLPTGTDVSRYFQDQETLNFRF